MKATLILAALVASVSLSPAAEKTDKPGKRDPEALFKKLDTNSDGTVAKEEYLASKRAKKDLAKAEKRFGKIDTNSDGKLSKEESAGLARKKKSDTAAAPSKTEAPKPADPKPEEKKPADPK